MNIHSGNIHISKHKWYKVEQRIQKLIACGRKQKKTKAKNNANSNWLCFHINWNLLISSHIYNSFRLVCSIINWVILGWDYFFFIGFALYLENKAFGVLGNSRMGYLVVQTGSRLFLMGVIELIHGNCFVSTMAAICNGLLFYMVLGGKR